MIWRAVVAVAVSVLLTAPAARAVEAPFAPDGAWCWFQDPRAVYDDGRTYTGYVTAAGDVAVSVYDHRANQLRRAIIARGFQRDDHASPALQVLADGRVMAIFSAHRGRQMYMRTTRLPHDITKWGDTRALGTNAPGFQTYTYANPVQAGRRLFLFWRAEAGSSAAGQAGYSVSDDGGDNWAPARVLVRNSGQRPYVKYHGRGDTIHVAYTEGHPNATQTGIRYAAFRDGKLLRANGTVLGSPPLRASAGESVYRGRSRAWIWDVASDPAGRPAIVYAIFARKTDHRYRYARWNGTRWVDRHLARAGGSIASAGREHQYSGGIALDHGDPSTVVMSRKVGGRFEIERWRTPDGGKSWTRAAITARSRQNNVRPVVPRGAPADGPASVLWMSGAYPGYTTYGTGIRALFPVAPTQAPAPPVTPQTPPPVGGPGGGGGPGGQPTEPEGSEAPPEGARVPGLRIKVNRAVVHPGQKVRITATMFDTSSRALLNSRTVVVYRRVKGTHAWRRTARLKTDKRGEVSVRRTVRRQTDFRVVYGGSPLMTAARSRVARVYVERRPSRLRGARD